MIAGIGIDIVDLRRITRILERFGERFLERILSQQEQALAQGSSAAFAGGRFAAKEACAKALGTGFAQGVMPADISVLPSASGRPELLLAGAALARAEGLGASRFHVSISHERWTAIALVILEK